MKKVKVTTPTETYEASFHQFYVYNSHFVGVIVEKKDGSIATPKSEEVKFIYHKPKK